MSEQVLILCANPHGLILEVGVGINAAGVPGRGPEYARAVLAGSNMHRPKDQRVAHGGTRSHTSVIPAPASTGLLPGVTKVNANLWARWVAAHEDHAMLRSGLLRALKPGEDLDTVSAEMAKIRTGLEPLNPGAMPAGLSPA
jgi:hypothetical protein